jgi:transcription-repair coupling factor (superfamily II helicase)
VENIELLTRYGSEETEVQLDRLGGGAWQARKSRMKQRIREMAGALMKIAAARILKEAPRLVPPEGLYDEFAARFPYDETEDQMNSIEAVLDDMGSGRPMDRLVCGDVGFGKTEVALRAAFVAAMSGKQVAIVVPTTLLARQHYRTFCDRFHGLPIQVAQASRFVPAAELKKVKEGLDRRHRRHRGRHPRAARQDIKFRDLGLIIVDEEHISACRTRSGLKELRAEVTSDPVGDPDPAHASAGADRRARALDHRDAPGRPPGRAHLRDARSTPSSSARRSYASATGGAKPSTSCPASRTSRG